MSRLSKNYKYLLNASFIISLFILIAINRTNSNYKVIPIALNISEFHQAYFTLIDKKKYTNNEIDVLFSKMNNYGNIFCHKLYNNELKFKDQSFVNKLKLKQVKFSSSVFLFNLLSGCLNFYKLNDHFVFEDFEYLNRLLGDKEKICYSVGFMQPYFMHASLNCKKLVFLDLDWRIHFYHKQILNAMSKNNFSSKHLIIKEMKKIILRWKIAYAEKISERLSNANIKNICHQLYQDKCIDLLMKFQKSYMQLEDIELQLAYFHNAEYKIKRKNLDLVINLSNAVDKEYTSKKQFKVFLKNLRNSFQTANDVYIIHHFSGRRAFALYKYSSIKENVKKKNIIVNNYELNTICRDSKSRQKNYFDKISKNKKFIPECHELQN